MTSDSSPVQNAAAISDQTGPLSFDTSKAHQARVYDYLLGGKDNYAADRAAAEKAAKVYPDGAFAARANRAFLGRAIRYLAGEEGIRQFLDIGTGIPTAGNVHEVAQAIAPESRVLYADYDPVVLAHARALLASHEAGATDYIEADLRDTLAILSHARGLLDFTRPVAVTLVAILHAIPDSDGPHEIVSVIMDALPPGSYLVVTHMARDILDGSTQRALDGINDGLFRQELTYRSREQVARFFEDMDLVEPGLVRAEQWRPDAATDDRGKSFLWSGVGRKR